MHDMEHYLNQALSLSELTNNFSLVSKPRGNLSGYERAIGMAGLLLRRKFDLKLTMHVTCRDLDFDNISDRLQTLVRIGVESILIISGEEYNQQEWAENRFKSSTQLLAHIISNYGGLFKQVGVAGYPSNTSDRAVEVLRQKLELGANLVITQCLFSVNNLREHAVLSNYDVDLYPSIAIFDHLTSLDKCCRLTRVQADGGLSYQMRARATDRQLSAIFAQGYLKDLAGSLCTLSPKIAGINICPFGNLGMTFELIKVLQKHH